MRRRAEPGPRAVLVDMLAPLLSLLPQANFTVGAVNPCNSVTATNACACTLNESDLPLESDYCVVQFPTALSVQTGTSTGLIYGRLFETGITPPAGASSWVAQVGYGPDNVNPENQSGWQWFSTAFNTQIGNDDEYQGSFTAPAVDVPGVGALNDPGADRGERCLRGSGPRRSCGERRRGSSRRCRRSSIVDSNRHCTLQETCFTLRTFSSVETSSPRFFTRSSFRNPFLPSPS